MTATTPIYGLSYPEGTDLVSSAPDSFKAMADTFETALDTVDKRSTPEGATPVIATTLEILKTQKATIGQTGFVTSDGDNTGLYAYDGTNWHHAYWYTADDKAKTTLVNASGWKCEYAIKRGFVYINITLSDSGTKGWSDSQMPGSLPEEARPAIDMSFPPICANNNSIGCFTITATGIVKYNRRGGGQVSDSRYIHMMWPAA